MDKAQLDRLLAVLVHWRGSDLHIKVGSAPSVRVNGDLRPLVDMEPPSAEDTRMIAHSIVPSTMVADFETKREVDFAYTVSDVGRFRVNAYYQRGVVSLALRWVPTEIPSREELHLPEPIYRLAEERRGMVLVTGPTGCGKSTTLASMVEHINQTRACHIITIEDPIEFVFKDHLARIDQREVGFDTLSFHAAMRVGLRQDPDVIMVGEMRDLETTWAALIAAETGHLVLSSLHTNDATDTVIRIVDQFPAHQQQQVRQSLARALRGTVAQRLVPRKDGAGRIPAVETMVVNGRIRQCIADMTRTSDIVTIVKEGDYYGMQSFDQSLFAHYSAGYVSFQEAMANATNPHDLRVLLEQRGLVSR